MKLSIHENHLLVNNTIVQQFNKNSKEYSRRRYSKVRNLAGVMDLKAPLRTKKEKLITNLSDFLVETLAINKEEFTKKDLDTLSVRLHYSRHMINKLRAINYFIYSELRSRSQAERVQESRLKKIKDVTVLGKDELMMLEYTAYKMIEKATHLDKRLLEEYASKEKFELKKEKTEITDVSNILKKQMSLLEHLESQLPPSSFINIGLVTDPIYSRWVSKVLSLVAYLVHLHSFEKKILQELVNSIYNGKRLEKKIGYLKSEQRSLFRILEEKSIEIAGDGSLEKSMRTTINL